MPAAEDSSPLDQLVELFVYAPVGMIYEYENVLPKLVKRGKSQVQLAKLLGQMAAKKGQAEVGDTVGGAVGGVASVLAQSITEFGTLIGLAPAPEPPAAGSTTPAAASKRPLTVVPDAETKAKKPVRKAAPKKADPKKSAAKKAAPKKAAAKKAATKKAATPSVVADLPLPIASYEELKAKDIVDMLGDLTPEQRERVREHESNTRGRRTILGKLDRLDRAES